MRRPEGKALVVGASRGTGAALVAEGSARGWLVRGTTRDGTAGTLRADVTDWGSLDRMSGRAGAIDLLARNAGVAPDRGVAL